ALNYTLVIENNYYKEFVLKFDTSNAKDCETSNQGTKLIAQLDNTPDRKSCQIKFSFDYGSSSASGGRELNFDAWLIVDNFVPEFKIATPTSNEGHHKCNNNTFDIWSENKSHPGIGVRCCTMKKSDKFGVLFVDKEKKCPKLTNS
ncbi:MAG: hypothetical protein AAF410_01485, partial [Pseudomonadota bacterium]